MGMIAKQCSMASKRQITSCDVCRDKGVATLLARLHCWCRDTLASWRELNSSGSATLRIHIDGL
jgi:hypothetical protein